MCELVWTPCSRSRSVRPGCVPGRDFEADRLAVGVCHHARGAEHRLDGGDALGRVQVVAVAPEAGVGRPPRRCRDRRVRRCRRPAWAGGGGGRSARLWARSGEPSRPWEAGSRAGRRAAPPRKLSRSTASVSRGRARRPEADPGSPPPPKNWLKDAADAAEPAVVEHKPAVRPRPRRLHPDVGAVGRLERAARPPRRAEPLEAADLAAPKRIPAKACSDSARFASSPSTS